MSDFDDFLGDEADLDTVTPPVRRVKEDLGPLQDLMLTCCPPNEDNVVSIALLAAQCDVTTQALFAIIRRGRITYTRAKQIVDLQGEDDVVSVADFADYLV